MFNPISLFIGLRYIRAKRRNHFISFISFASMAGIALGVMVLITVLSVMNGFDHQIRANIFSMARQITVGQHTGTFQDWKHFEQMLQAESHVIGVAPFIDGQGMLSYQGVVQPALISGILPAEQRQVSTIEHRVIEGTLNRLEPGRFRIALGNDMARHLALNLGDKVTVITPEATVSAVGILPRFKRFTVAAIFETDSHFDGQTALINLYDAQRLFNLNGISGLRVKVDDLYVAPKVTAHLTQTLERLYGSGRYWVSDWTEQYGEYFKAIRMEKTMMFLILLLIIAVAGFNLVASLVMVVTDKRADIAILLTMGATPKMILSIFIVQGSVIGLIGTLLGVLLGVLLSLNVTGLVTGLEHILHRSFVSAAFYYVDYLPSELQLMDVLKVMTFTLTMSFLATIYPAWQAARIQPAEALRYE